MINKTVEINHKNIQLFLNSKENQLLEYEQFLIHFKKC